MESYEVEEDHNVPRGSMYAHYLIVCQQQGVRPVNSASFGKLIRTVFPDLKTRRLGTRGQSKYPFVILLHELSFVADGKIKFKHRSSSLTFSHVQLLRYPHKEPSQSRKKIDRRTCRFHACLDYE